MINNSVVRGIGVPNYSNAYKEHQHMYLDNKYTNWYKSIITKAQSRVTDSYTEKHHIIPRFLGGTNAPDNLVKLTAREHFVCHWLLMKMVTGNKREKMVYAFRMMRVTSKDHNGNRYYTKLTSRIFEKYRVEHTQIHSKNMKGRVSPTKGMKFGPQPASIRLKNSQSNIGKNLGKEPGNKNKPQPEYIKAKKRKPKPIATCPHCGTEGGKSAMARWHFDNCKLFVVSKTLEPRKS